MAILTTATTRGGGGRECVTRVFTDSSRLSAPLPGEHRGRCWLARNWRRPSFQKFRPLAHQMLWRWGKGVALHCWADRTCGMEAFLVICSNLGKCSCLSLPFLIPTIWAWMYQANKRRRCRGWRKWKMDFLPTTVCLSQKEPWLSWEDHRGLGRQRQVFLMYVLHRNIK